TAARLPTRTLRFERVLGGLLNTGRRGESDFVRSYFFASGCQFWMSVIGAVALSSSGFIRRPLCRQFQQPGPQGTREAPHPSSIGHVREHLSSVQQTQQPLVDRDK